jgi:hypothetical protein
MVPVVVLCQRQFDIDAVLMLIRVVRPASPNLAKYFYNLCRPRICPLVDHGVSPERSPA